MKIADTISPFLVYISTERRLSQHTVDAYSSDLDQFVTYLSSQWNVLELEALSYQEISEWQMHLMEDEKSATSVKRKLSTLRTWCRFLRKQRWLEKDLMAKVVAPKSPKRLPVFFTEKETRKIYDTTYFKNDFDGKRDQLLLRLLYETGIRRSEAATLTEDAVDLATRTIKVHGKRDKDRIIPIENELAHTIKCYFSLKVEIEGCSTAFFVRSDGTPFTQYNISKVVKDYMTFFSNAERISPHIFRHSFATHLLNEGADINAIKELLGHTDLAATEVYTHVSREHLKETYQHAHPRSKNGLSQACKAEHTLHCQATKKACKK